VKLYARTPTGTGLGIDVLLTGQVREDNGTLRSVEIYMPIGCDLVVGYRIEKAVFESLPQGRGSRQVLWVDPGDLCADDGNTVNQAQIRAEVVRVNEQLRAEMLRGPLGENWP
jgi:hypothetical protein